MQPYGGSEIQLEYLQKHVSKDLLDKINLTISIPEKTPLVFDKPNVLWIQNSYDQVIDQVIDQVDDQVFYQVRDQFEEQS